MILGEAAAALTLEAGHHPNALAIITGVGYATEALKHSTSISANAECFQKSMRMALDGRDPQDIDAIVMHAPGTIAGDMSEFRAIQEVFPTLPALTTGKWQTGHTFAASGLLGIEMAIQMLQTGQWLGSPFYKCEPKKLERAMVNSVGFGGNAVSVVLNLKI
jgi:3-oxoacyl-[acyl-carrier-protein] synthase II